LVHTMNFQTCMDFFGAKFSNFKVKFWGKFQK